MDTMYLIVTTTVVVAFIAFGAITMAWIISYLREDSTKVDNDLAKILRELDEELKRTHR